MDHGAFGELTTAMARATSRRAGLRAVVAIVLGGAGAGIATDAGAATTCRRGRQTCQRNNQCCSGTCQTGRGFSTRERNRCTCEDGLQVCNNACVDIDTDERHCGACGNRCGAGDRCIDGECRINQQCYTQDGGFCYMTPDGREHRGDGFYIPSGFDALPCTANLDCNGVYETCSVPGVECPCVRAFDFGGGYMGPEEAGTGVCLPVLDNGDGAVSCRPTSENTVCVYTSDHDELEICESLSTELGPCVGYGCAGVGNCDDADVDCACVIALQFPISINSLIYFNFGNFTPMCVAYEVPVDGVCAPPV